MNFFNFEKKNQLAFQVATRGGERYLPTSLLMFSDNPNETVEAQRRRKGSGSVESFNL